MNKRGMYRLSLEYESENEPDDEEQECAPDDESIADTEPDESIADRMKKRRRAC